MKTASWGNELGTLPSHGVEIVLRRPHPAKARPGDKLAGRAGLRIGAPLDRLQGCIEPALPLGYCILALPADWTDLAAFPVTGAHGQQEAV